MATGFAVRHIAVLCGLTLLGQAATADNLEQKHARACRVLCPSWSQPSSTQQEGSLHCHCFYDEYRATEQEKFQKRQADEQAQKNLFPPDPKEEHPELREYEVSFEVAGSVGGSLPH